MQSVSWPTASVQAARTITSLSADPLALVPQLLDPCGNPLPWGPTARDSANQLGYVLGLDGQSNAEPTGDASESLRPFVAEGFYLGLDEGLLSRQWTRERRDAERERYGWSEPGEGWHENERREAWGR